MNLVKWFRKNSKKVMAIIVIVMLFGFVGGSYIQQLGQRRRTGLRRTVAWLGDGKKITNYDLALARRELEILKMLRANDMLRNIVILEFRTKDLCAFLLSELLFSDRTISPILINHIKQTIRANEYRISDKQINDIYRGSADNYIYWLLLKNEAEQAGIRISNKNVGNLLGTKIPEFFPDTTYSQVIGSIINRQGVPEEEVLAMFGKLLTVFQYAKTTCSSEDVTTRQIMHKVSMEEEKIDIEFVRFDSAVFAETQSEPTPQEISAHFDRYKKFFAGAISEENPYGFGYKLPDRVGLGYIAIKLDDVSGIVTPPTQEESEEYYQKHREQFTVQVPSDPNDPNSPPIERVKSYAEMASIISKILLQNKTNSKADRILQEARTDTEVGFEGIDTEPQNLSAEQFRKMVGDYKTVAEELSKKYGIKIYAGQTELLSAVDIQTDKHLGMLYMESYGYNPVYNPTVVVLPKIVFAIDEVGVSELGLFDVPKPRMYENIGPLKDVLGRIMAVVRVIKAEKAAEPESINQTFSKSTLIFEQTAEQVSKDVFSVKENVVKDLKRLSAMDITKSKAEKFISLAAKVGWENAIKKFNKLYGQTDRQDKSDLEAANVIEDIQKPFKLQDSTNLQRISRRTIGTLAVQSAGDPAAQFSAYKVKKEGLLREQLYSLVPQKRDTIDTLPLIIEFKPDMSHYVIKDISVKHLERDKYEKMKGMLVYREDFVQSQTLAAVHFNPENILKRTKFRWVEQEKETTDANIPAESKEAL